MFDKQLYPKVQLELSLEDVVESTKLTRHNLRRLLKMVNGKRGRLRYDKYYAQNTSLVNNLYSIIEIGREELKVAIYPDGEIRIYKMFGAKNTLPLVGTWNNIEHLQKAVEEVQENVVNSNRRYRK